MLFALVEGFALQIGLTELVKSLNLPFLNGPAPIRVVSTLLPLSIGLGIGYLIFVKLVTRLWLKVLLALVAILVSATASIWIGTTIMTERCIETPSNCIPQR